VHFYLLLHTLVFRTRALVHVRLFHSSQTDPNGGSRHLCVPASWNEIFDNDETCESDWLPDTLATCQCVTVSHYTTSLTTGVQYLAGSVVL
jgi:hypothetical protein